jgi:hypothetical protein
MMLKELKLEKGEKNALYIRSIFCVLLGIK